MSVKLNSALGGSVTLNEPATASAFTLTLPTDNIQPGMNLITPTSVVGGTFNGGAISFSAATSVSVNGCFSSLYSNYLLISSWSVAAASSKTSFLRWRTSGVDNTSAVYHTNINGTYVYSATSHDLGQNYYDGSSGGYGFSMTVIDPQNSLVTNGFGGIKGASGSFNLPAPCAFAHSSLTQFDGLTLAITASTFTGTLRIYGMRNQ